MKENLRDSNPTAIILAAGKGTRLLPITKRKPKCLVNVSNKPIIAYQLEALKKNNIYNVVICIGYKAEQVVKYCRENFKDLDIKFVVNESYKTTNNMFSLYLARQYLKNEVLVINGDVIFSEKILAKMLNGKGSLVAVDKDRYLEESMKVKVKNNYIIDISKKIPESESYGVSIDVYKFSSPDIKIIKSHLVDIIEKEKDLNQWTEVLLQRLFQSNLVKSSPCNVGTQLWWEVDNYEDLNQAEKLFNNNLKDIFKRKLFLIDGDGSLYVGSSKIDGAESFLENLRKNGITFKILTNNSSKTTLGHVEKLGRIGFKIDNDEVVVSTDSLILHLRVRDLSRIYLLANEEVTNYFESCGFILDYQEPQAVVLTYDNRLTYDKLSKGISFIRKGLPYFATHIDILYPSEEGFLPDIGSFY